MMYELQPFRIQHQQKAFGLLMPKNSMFNGLTFVAIAVLWIGVFSQIFFQEDLTEGSFFIGFILLIAGTIAMAFVMGLIYRLLIDLRLGQPTMKANMQVLQRGEQLHVVFEQPLKTRLALNHASLRLVRFEWVEYQQGTDTIREEYDDVIDEVSIENTILNKGETLRLDAAFYIPGNAMHNFSTPHNRIQWVVAVSVDMKAWPNFFERYELELPPR